jgi:hypothetical protein
MATLAVDDLGLLVRPGHWWPYVDRIARYVGKECCLEFVVQVEVGLRAEDFEHDRLPNVHAATFQGSNQWDRIIVAITRQYTITLEKQGAEVIGDT